jgi:hypothetical protein
MPVPSAGVRVSKKENHAAAQAALRMDFFTKAFLKKSAASKNAGGWVRPYLMAAPTARFHRQRW